MTMRGPVLCLACTRLHHDTVDVVRCDAYPTAIPEDILNDGADHHTARGDEVSGLTFNAATSPGAQVALDAWTAIFGPNRRA